MSSVAQEAAKSTQSIKVFISYSHKDLAFADRIVEALQKEGFAVTIDRRDLPYGEEWQKELADFIRACDTVVWLVSPNSIQSKWCNWELGEVRALNKRLIPVVTSPVPSETLPEAIGKIHLLPAEGAFAFETHLDMLVTALNSDRAWIKEHTRLSDRAQQWLGRQRSGALLLRGAALKDAERWRAARPAKAPPPSGEILELMLASRHADTRRLRWMVTGSALAALFAFALTGVTIWQWRNAETSYGAARTTVDRLITELATGLQNAQGLPVATVNSSLDVVRSLVLDLQAVRGEDPLLERSRAAMLYQFAKTYQKIEDRRRAIEASSASLAIRRKLVAADATSDAFRWDLVQGLHLEGDLARELRQLGRARELYQESVEETVLLNRAHPLRIDYEIGVSWGLVRLGDIDSFEKKLETARSRYEEAFSRTTSAFRRSDAGAAGDMQRELTWNYNKLGDIEILLGRPARAIQFYEKGLCTRQVLAKNARTNTLLQFDVSWSYEKIAKAYEKLGDAVGATNAHFSALMIRRELAGQDGAQLIWLRDLSSSLHQIGDAKQRSGDLASAIAFYNAALDSRRLLQRRKPDFQGIGDLLKQSIDAAAESRARLVSQRPIDAEQVWTEVVGEEIEAMRSRLALAERDPVLCWETLSAELRDSKS